MVRTLKGSKQVGCLTLSGSGSSCNRIRGLRAEPLAHGYSITSFQDANRFRFHTSTQLCELLRNLKILPHLVKYPALEITQTFQLVSRAAVSAFRYSHLHCVRILVSAPICSLKSRS